VDIASPVEEGDRATGYGVTLLPSLFAQSIQNPAFKHVAYEHELPLKNDYNVEADD